MRVHGYSVSVTVLNSYSEGYYKVMFIFNVDIAILQIDKLLLKTIVAFYVNLS